MKKIKDIETITESDKMKFEESLKKIINMYESWDYEVKVQYSISTDQNSRVIYSALVMGCASFTKGGYRIYD